MGGSLKISLSNGWFSIRYYLCMMIFFWFGTEGRYSVTSGSIFLCVFVLFCKADILSRCLTSDRCLSITLSL